MKIAINFVILSQFSRSRLKTALTAHLGSNINPFHFGAHTFVLCYQDSDLIVVVCVQRILRVGHMYMSD